MTATIIAVAQRKGGAGKTTLAVHLAVAWAHRGASVALVDTDPQASSSSWHRVREVRYGAGSTGIDFAAVTGWRAASEVSRRSRDRDIILIDSPANADSELKAALRNADLVLVPVQPTPLDVWATRPTLAIAEAERIPSLLVLNRVPARARLTGAMRDWLSDYDVGLAESTVGNRTALAAAISEGQGVTEAAAGSPAAEEIAALGEEILDLLPRR